MGQQRGFTASLWRPIDHVYSEILAHPFLAELRLRSLGPSQRKNVTEALVTTSRYEWMFWNMGWTLEE